MSPSNFKTRLAAGEPVFAVNVGGRNADTLASLAWHGAHAAFIDCERSGIALDGAAELLFAAHAAGLPALVRPHSADQAELVRFLDRGADGLVVPHCDSARDAAAAVEVMRYACGKAASDKTLIVQIETRNAVAELEAIAAVPGIDAFLIGPNDLAWEVCGERGAKNAQMTQIVDDICQRLGALGKRYGMPGPLAELPQFRQRGCSFVYYAMDWLIESGMRELRGAFAQPH
jgi:4-hydroxy-2-oxoheptanedioate aldolase